MTDRSRNQVPPSHPAFTRLEIILVLGILGVLAALVVPQFSDASFVNVQAGSLRSDLRSLRTQIMVYRAQHHGVSPGYPPGGKGEPDYQAFVDQLTLFSDADGETSPTPSAHFVLGPYVVRIPVDSIKGSSRIHFVARGEPFPSEPNGSEGWVYQPETGMIAANAPGQDVNSRAYFDY